MRAEKEGGGWVSVKPGLKHYRQGTHEMQQMGELNATIATNGYRDTEITQEHASQKNWGGSQLSRDQTKPEREREREREHLRAEKE